MIWTQSNVFLSTLFAFSFFKLSLPLDSTTSVDDWPGIQPPQCFVSILPAHTKKRPLWLWPRQRRRQAQSLHARMSPCLLLRNKRPNSPKNAPLYCDKHAMINVWMSGFPCLHYYNAPFPFKHHLERLSSLLYISISTGTSSIPISRLPSSSSIPSESSESSRFSSVSSDTKLPRSQSWPQS